MHFLFWKRFRIYSKGFDFGLYDFICEASTSYLGGASPLQPSPPAGTTSPLDTPKRPYGAEIPRWKLIIAYRAVHPAIQPLDGLKFSPFYRVKSLRCESKIRKNGLKSKLSRAFSRDVRILKLFFSLTAESWARRPLRRVPKGGTPFAGSQGRRPWYHYTMMNHRTNQYQNLS